MDTKNVLPSTAQITSLSGSSSTGSLLIRAPPTIDDDGGDGDSDFEPKPPRIYGQGTSCSDESSERGSDCERLYTSGDDFETASERPSVADPDEETLKGGGEIVKDQIFRPFVAYPDADKLENSCSEEMCSDVDEYSSAAETLAVYDHDPIVDQVMPIARLSMDFEDEDGLMVVEEGGDEEIVRAARVPSFDMSEMVGSAPWIRAAVDEEERDECESSLYVRDGIETHSTRGEYISECSGLASVRHARVMSLKDEEGSFMEQDLRMPAEFNYSGVEGRRIESSDSHRSNDERVWELKNEKLSDAGFAEKCGTTTASEAVEEPVVGKGAICGAGLTLEDHLNNGTPHLQIVSKGPEVAGEVKHSDDTNEMDSLDQALRDHCDLLNSVFTVSPSDYEPELEAADAENEPLDKRRGGKRVSEDEFASSFLSRSLNSQVHTAIYGGHIVSESSTEEDSYVYGGQNFLVDLDILGDLLKPSSCTESEENLRKDEKKRFEDLHLLKVKLFRLVHRLGCSPENSIATQASNRLALTIGSHSTQAFRLESANKLAMQLEAEGGSIDLSLNILVIGKTGVGKSATINTVLGEKKATVNAFEPATVAVKEVLGIKDGVKFRFIDTPGLRSSGAEQSLNRRILLSIKKFTKSFPPDVVMYVDRLDCPTSDPIDLPLLWSITNSLGSTIWRNAIIVLTHASSTPLDGPTGSPFSHKDLVARQSSVIWQCISSAIGDKNAMNPFLMPPVFVVENRLSEKNELGCWRTQLLILCCSLKILREASSLSKPQESLNLRKIRDFCVQSFALLVIFSIATSNSPKTFC